MPYAILASCYRKAVPKAKNQKLESLQLFVILGLNLESHSRDEVSCDVASIGVKVTNDNPEHENGYCVVCGSHSSFRFDPTIITLQLQKASGISDNLVEAFDRKESMFFDPTIQEQRWQ